MEGDERQVFHIDGDVLFNVPPEQLMQELRGKTLVIQGCPAFTSIGRGVRPGCAVMTLRRKARVSPCPRPLGRGAGECSRGDSRFFGATNGDWKSFTPSYPTRDSTSRRGISTRQSRIRPSSRIEVRRSSTLIRPGYRVSL